RDAERVRGPMQRHRHQHLRARCPPCPRRREDPARRRERGARRLLTRCGGPRRISRPLARVAAVEPAIPALRTIPCPTPRPMRTQTKRFVAALPLLLLSACGYNRIQSLDEQATAAQSQIEVQLQRRADLIPNLVET